MRETKFIVLCFMVMIAFASSAYPRTQQYYEWRGTVSSDWSNALNWSPNTAIPPTRDTAGVLADPFGKAGFKGTAGSVPASPVIGVGTTVSTDQIVIGGGNSGVLYGGGDLTLGGGTINVSEFTNIGNARTSDTQYDFGTLTVNSGTLNNGVMVPAEGRLICGLNGTGYIIQNGGVINLKSLLIIAQNAATAPNTSKGFVNLFGGVFNAGIDLTMGGTSANSKITITDGRLVFSTINATLSGKLATWIGNGQIVTTKPDGDIVVSTDDLEGTTTVYAIPEPATVCLLGLGAMALLRRNKK